MKGFDFSSLGRANADYTIGSAFADALGIPLRRKPVELRKQVDIPYTMTNRKERRQMRRQVKP